MLCLFICNPLFVFAGTLAFNEIQLRNGDIVAFSSFAKVGDKALKVVTEDGQKLLIPRQKLSDAEIIRRFGALVPIHYGKAVYVSSKLPADFNPYEFRDAIKIRYEQLNLYDWKSQYYPMKYYLFVPERKNIKKTEKVPLVVFLHGMGDQNHMNRHPQCLIFVQPEIQKKYPCYFMAPLLHKDEKVAWTGSSSFNKNNCISSMQSVIDIIDNLIKKNPNIDEDRIYLTGLSSGGIGCWEAVTKFPGKFAGIVPIAGASPYCYGNIKLPQKVAVWAFCNPHEKQYVRNFTAKMLKRAADLGADSRYSKFRITKQYDKQYKHSKNAPKLSAGHAAQNWAYAESDLIPWLFAHKRETKEVR